MYLPPFGGHPLLIVLRATEAVFDRITGDPVEADRLKTYAEARAVTPELRGQVLERSVL